MLLPQTLSRVDISYVAIGFFAALMCIIFSAFPVYRHGEENEAIIVTDFNYMSFKYILVIEMCVSVLVILEVMVDYFSRGASLFSFKEFGVITILLSLFISSAITFYYCLPYGDFLLYNGIWYFRAVTMSIATILVARSYDSKMWDSPIMVFGIFIGCVGCVFAVFLVPLFQIIANIFTAIFWIVIIVYHIKWYRYLWIASYHRRVTNNEWNCTVILALHILIMIASMVGYSVNESLTYTSIGTTTMILDEVWFTVYVVVVSIQQRRNIGKEVYEYQSELEFKRMFVRYISHEVRTPLNTAIIGLQVLMEKMSSQDSLMCTDSDIDTVIDIRTSCDIAVNVLNELLTFDKLEAGTLMIEKDAVHAMSLIEESVQPFQIQARQKDIILTIHNACSDRDLLIQTVINADKSKIAQIIRNMVSNALKFTPKDGTVDVFVDLADTSDTVDDGHKKMRMVKVDVVDSGAGISEENQKKLFKEIVQFNPAKLQEGGGSGLGLYISHGIASLHDGSLSAHSRGEGHGCTFTLTLPTVNMRVITEGTGTYRNSKNENTAERTEPNIEDEITAASVKRKPNNCRSTSRLIYIADKELEDAVETEESQGARSRRNPHLDKTSETGDSKEREEDDERSYRTGGNKVVKIRVNDRAIKLASRGCASPLSIAADNMRALKVLVVDDSDMSRKMQCRLLKTRFDHCEETDNGQKAVQRALEKSKAIDLILMDANMPVMGGLEAAKKLREHGYKGLIVGVTGNVTKEDIDLYISSGANAVLAKPLEIRELEVAVKKLLLKPIESY